MDTFFYLAIGAIAFVALYPALRMMAGAYLKFRGTRVITCPENAQPAAVEVNATRAALAMLTGAPRLRLKDCSRWPEKRNCGQECLREIAAAPENCLLRAILARWYRGKSCALCGRPLGDIHLVEHKPALLNPEGGTLEWGDVPPETLPSLLVTHRPICWNCHVAETFRRCYPDLVTDRPWSASERTRRDQMTSKTEPIEIKASESPIQSPTAPQPVGKHST